MKTLFKKKLVLLPFWRQGCDAALSGIWRQANTAPQREMESQDEGVYFEVRKTSQ